MASTTRGNTEIKVGDKPYKRKDVTFTANDIDGAYLLGVFNSVGLDGLGEEIKRLKTLKVLPHHIIMACKNKNPDLC